MGSDRFLQTISPALGGRPEEKKENFLVFPDIYPWYVATTDVTGLSRNGDAEPRDAPETPAAKAQTTSTDDLPRRRDAPKTISSSRGNSLPLAGSYLQPIPRHVPRLVSHHVPLPIPSSFFPSSFSDPATILEREFYVILRSRVRAPSLSLSRARALSFPRRLDSPPLMISMTL